ncbi:MAG TPA: hypothetical protein VGQ33_02470, partial [Vicinamibacteria bacterium]|nr:hypothetical protein [Vicinamibacteria bacterium]
MLAVGVIAAVTAILIAASRSPSVTAGASLTRVPFRGVAGYPALPPVPAAASRRRQSSSAVTTVSGAGGRTGLAVRPPP